MTYIAIPIPLSFSCLFLPGQFPHHFLALAVNIFAYGIGPCSNKSPVASTVLLPVEMSFFSVQSQQFPSDTLFPRQALILNARIEPLLPLHQDFPLPLVMRPSTNMYQHFHRTTVLPFGNGHQKQLLAGPGGTGM